MVFDHTGPDLNLASFQDKDWSSTPYGEYKVEILPMPISVEG